MTFFKTDIASSKATIKPHLPLLLRLFPSKEWEALFEFLYSSIKYCFTESKVRFFSISKIECFNSSSTFKFDRPAPLPALKLIVRSEAAWSTSVPGHHRPEKFRHSLLYTTLYSTPLYTSVAIRQFKI